MENQDTMMMIKNDQDELQQLEAETLNPHEPPTYLDSLGETNFPTGRSQQEANQYMSVMASNQYPSRPRDSMIIPDILDRASSSDQQTSLAIISSQPGQNSSISMSDSVLAIKEDGENFLNYLSQSSKVIVKQEVDICCLITKCTGTVNFTIIDEGGNILFYANEISNCFCRQHIFNRRCFEMYIKDRTGRIMMKLVRKCDVSCCWGLLWADKITAHLPNYEYLGSVLQNCSFSPSFTILNSLVQPIMSLTGPAMYCTFFPGQRVEYQFFDRQVRQVGRIEKEWSGCGKEWYSSYDNFSMEFPAGTSPQEKALCLASLIMVNIRHYEKSCLPKILIFPLVLLICLILI